MVETASDYAAFISYATANRDSADDIRARIEASGLRCWIAPRDVRAGREYGEEIVRGIERSRCFVLILSAAANASPFVAREVERAVAKGRAVFPVRIEPVLPSPRLELFVSSAHWIDAFQDDPAAQLQRLVQDLAGPDHSPGPPRENPADAAEARLRVSGSRRLVAALLTLTLVAALAAVGYRYNAFGGPRERADAAGGAPERPAAETPAPPAAEPSAPDGGTVSVPPSGDPAPRARSGPRGAGDSRRARQENQPAPENPVPESQAPRNQAGSSRPPVDQAASGAPPPGAELLAQLGTERDALVDRAAVADVMIEQLAAQMRPNALRGDVLLRQRTAARALSDAGDALNNLDATTARARIDRAREAVEWLERFFGR